MTAVLKAARRRTRTRVGVVAAVAAVLASLMNPTIASALPASLDPTFGTGGVVALPPAMAGVPADETMYPVQVVATTDGAVWTLETAFSYNMTTMQMRTVNRLTRVSASASTTSVPLDEAPPGQIRLMAYGSSVMLASTAASGASVLRRYLPDMTLDPAFAGDGQLSTATNDLGVTLPSPALNCPSACAGVFMATMARDIAGRILVGYQEWGGRTSVVRLLGNGSLDTLFGDAGFAVAPVPNNSLSLTTGSITLDPSGRIVGADRSSVFRLLPDGSVDTGFGAAGRLSLENLSSIDWMCSGAGSVAVTRCSPVFDPAGSIIIAGELVVDWSDFYGTPGFLVVEGDGSSTEFAPMCNVDSVDPPCSNAADTFVTTSGGQSHLHYAERGVLRSLPLPLPMDQGPLGAIAQGQHLSQAPLMSVARGSTNNQAVGGALTWVSGVDKPSVAKLLLDSTAPPYVPPTGTLSPAPGSFALGSNVPVTFSCANTAQCSARVVEGEVPDPIPAGWVPVTPQTQIQSGGLLDTSVAGVRNVIVEALDPEANALVVVARARYETIAAPPAGVSGTTGNGGTLSTGAAVSPSDPLATSVTTPVGGFVQLVDSATTTTDPVGYGLFGHQVAITAPAQSAAAPLELVFQLYPTLLEGTAASQVRVWRNGALVPNCVGGTAATAANPDPCVKRRLAVSGGGVTITVLSSNASVWTFGRLTAVAPSAPLNVTASPGIGSAAVSWSAPASDGGAPIGTYLVTATPDTGSLPLGVTAVVRTATVTGSPAATAVTVPSLVKGVTYSFTVKARNTVATAYGPSSDPSAPVTLSALPGAPTITGVVAGVKSATVSWSAPASNEPLTKYTVVATAIRPDSTIHKVTKSVTGTPPEATTVVTSLLPGLSYSFTVSASSAAGTGAASTPSTPVTLSALPESPVISAAVPGVKSATVSWDAPLSAEPITKYTVVATATRPDSTVHKVTKSVVGSPPAPSTVVTGLTPDLSYSFTVSASSVVGTGLVSLPFGPVLLSGLPEAPTITNAQAGGSSASVAWTAPASDEEITKYTVTATATRPDASIHKVTKSVLGSTGVPPATSTTVTGLTVGLEYSFTVSATSAVGTGAASATAGPVSPVIGLSISDRSATEGNSGQKSFTFTVTMSAVSTVPVTVDVSTHEISVNDNDFTPLVTAVTFTPGQKSKAVTVRVNGDTTYEQDEQFSVVLSNASAGIITDADASGTILNDDT